MNRLIGKLADVCLGKYISYNLWKGAVKLHAETFFPLAFLDNYLAMISLNFSGENDFNFIIKISIQLLYISLFNEQCAAKMTRVFDAAF